MSLPGGHPRQPGRQGRRPGPIYAIADIERLGAAQVPRAVAAMASAGILTIQIRARRLADRELAGVARAALDALEGWPGELWIDDRVDLARCFPFAGVHLGQHDLEVPVARGLLGDECALGVSTHDEGQLAEADAEPAADWLALGPIFATASKEAPDPVVGLARLRACRAATSKPLIAIGGIDERNLASVFAAGADSVAVLSAVCDGEIAAAARRLVERSEEARCASS